MQTSMSKALIRNVFQKKERKGGGPYGFLVFSRGISVRILGNHYMRGTRGTFFTRRKAPSLSDLKANRYQDEFRPPI